MEFDEADVAQLEADGELEAVILHEMAHVLGLGTLWDTFNLNEGLRPLLFPILRGCSDVIPNSAIPLVPGYDPRYIGLEGVAQYQRLGGPDPTIPIEDCEDLPPDTRCGAGTRDGHWKESIFDTELMTGYLNGGEANLLSAFTADQFADFGYDANIDAADQGYEIPAAGARAAPARKLQLPEDTLLFPLTLIDRQGNVTGFIDRHSPQ